MRHDRHAAWTSRAMRRRALPPLLAAGFLLCGACGATKPEAQPAPPPEPPPPSDRWEFVGRPILEPKDISAVELVDGRYGLIASDEGRHVQSLKLEGTRMTVGEALSLPNLGGKELDLEAIAAAPEGFYVVGSHGATRGKAKLRPERSQVFALAVDPAANTVRLLRQGSLAALLERELPAYVGRPLQRNGANIEALAYAGERLFAGFRGPSVDGKAPVIRFDPAEVLDDPAAARGTTFWLALGDGVGIRGMCSVPGGFLLLTGDNATDARADDAYQNVFAPGHPFQVRFWDGSSSATQVLHTFPDLGGTKAEALTYIGDSADGLQRVLVVFEGPPDGNPTELRLATTAPSPDR